MVQEEEKGKDQRSPGALLRTGRESAGLSIEQVADKLHLLQSVISSLETDCYDRIRGDTFVRGYMRNYARLLGINDDEVVARYTAGKPAPGRGESRFARRRENWHGSTGAGRVGVVLALMAVSVLVLFYNRQPPTVATHDGVEAVTVETARGMHVVPLAGPVRRVQQ
ncbi:MAG: helix-turn-helix domain-containing protein [Gammaproteobacteria bacterium]|nr:helix-turn-helix domain-containing protein [Gammaproteobacteria bacterium]